MCVKFFDTGGAEIVAGDEIMIEICYSTPMYRGRRAMVTYDEKIGAFRYHLIFPPSKHRNETEETVDRAGSTFEGIGAFRKIVKP